MITRTLSRILPCVFSPSLANVSSWLIVPATRIPSDIKQTSSSQQPMNGSANPVCLHRVSLLCWSRFRDVDTLLPHHYNLLIASVWVSRNLHGNNNNVRNTLLVMTAICSYIHHVIRWYCRVICGELSYRSCAIQLYLSAPRRRGSKRLRGWGRGRKCTKAKLIQHQRYGNGWKLRWAMAVLTQANHDQPAILKLV